MVTTYSSMYRCTGGEFFGEFEFVAYLLNLFSEAQELFLCFLKDFKEVFIHQ